MTRDILPDRKQMLASIEANLTQYLSEAADKSTGTVGIEEIFALDPSDLDRALAYRFVTSTEASRALAAIEAILPFLPPTRRRVLAETSGYMRGNVLWSRTLERRLSSNDPTIFVASTAERRYDTPTARLVNDCLSRIVTSARRTGLSRSTGTDTSELWSRTRWASRYLQHPKLAGSHGHLREQDLEALSARAPLEPLVDLIRLHSSLQRHDPAAVSHAMCAAVLAPRSTHSLFELYVLFRLIDAFEALGYARDRPWRLIDGQAPVATLRDAGRTISIYWQRSLNSFSSEPMGLGQQIAMNNGLHIGAARPDVLVVIDSPTGRFLRFGEIKYYNAPQLGVAAGIADCLAYLKDAEGLFLSESQLPKAFLVVAGVSRARPNAGPVIIGSESQLPELARLLCANLATPAV